MNSAFEPVRVINWQKALILWLQGKVEILEFHAQFVRSSRESFQLPSVIRLKTYIRPWVGTRIKLSRENVYLRDGHICQYCQKRFGNRELTFDHVVPVSRGGRKTWDNIVTACRPCNHRKGNRTPEAVGMKLIRKPKRPKWRAFVHFSFTTGAHESWKHFIDVAYWNVELGN